MFHEEFVASTQAIAKELGIQLPTSYYRYAPSKCWKCEKNIILYTYPGCNQGIGGIAPDPTHEPIPSTLKKCFSGIIGNMPMFAHTAKHYKGIFTYTTNLKEYSLVWVI